MVGEVKRNDMKPDQSTLTTMRQTGREIASIFAHSMSDDEKARVASELLALMRSNPLDHQSHAAHLMLLGALAAVGREEQCIG